MGKKKRSDGSSLGRTLIKDMFGHSKGKKMVSHNSMLHTSEIKDGYDWGRLNLQSVTEESSFQEFLSTAELAGTEFQSEKLNIQYVNPNSNVGLLSKDEMKNASNAHKKFKEALKIPRRPPWDSTTTPSQLDFNEKQEFLEWRRGLAQLQESEGILLTPYEKNLEFWRQLWRVVERSDVIIQIVDARNPLLFRCEDLEKYVKEVSKDKLNLILINKADFLTKNQRQSWADYFSAQEIQVVFFSAQLAFEEAQKNSIEHKEQSTRQSTEAESSSEESDEEPNIDTVSKNIADLNVAVEQNGQVLNTILSKLEKIVEKTKSDEIKIERIKIYNSSQLLCRDELIGLFSKIHRGPKVTERITTIGLVGYPNVGKSSTINALLSAKKVSVSATPGKTKHFQTLFLTKDILLCDCPGLVMPRFVFTKAEMVLNGILPIDQMRDHVPPTNLVTSLIPRDVIENKYGIMLPLPMEGEDPDRSPTAEELLNAYAFNRGFMTANGQPDNSRAARYILKDYVNGKLLFCHAPPTVDQEQYQLWPEKRVTQSENKILPPRAVRAMRPYQASTNDIDKDFFVSGSQSAHTKGVSGKLAGMPKKSNPEKSLETTNTSKPWKQYNKHKNKAKKEKLRRVYVHLDQH